MVTTCQASASALRSCGGVRRPGRGVYGICRGHRRRSSCHGRWRRYILVCHGQSEDCRPLQILHDSKLMKTFLLLPHSNADSERVFSTVNKICTEDRADLAQDTVAALLSVKVNSRVDSQRFEPSRNELSKAESATMEYNRLHLHPACCHVFVY